MSLGSDFIGGFTAVKDAKARNAKMEQDERLAQADAQLRREMQQRQIDSDVMRMREGFGHSSTEADKDRSWRTGERTGSETFTAGQNTADRTFRTSERLGGQEFAATQQRKDQDFRGSQADKDRLAREVDNAAQNIFRDRQLAAQEKQAEAQLKLMGQRTGPRWEQTVIGTNGSPDTKIHGYGMPPGGMPQRGGTTQGSPLPAVPAPFGDSNGGAPRANQTPAPSFTQNLLSAGTTMRGGMAGMAPRGNPAAVPQDPTSYEGKIVRSPDGKRARIVNGQPIPIDQ